MENEPLDEEMIQGERWPCGSRSDALNMNTSDINAIPNDPAVRREWIKFQLAIRGYTLAALAREHGVTRQQPQAALNRPYPKWERIIADLLELKPEQLWPERYNSQAN